MSATRIHHINFVVHELEKAAARFEKILRLAPFEYIDHSPRGARIARSRLGEAWIVLVCPVDPESVPGRHLATHGEGFFLLSAGTDDLSGHLEELDAGGHKLLDQEERNGILDWRVADIAEVNGVLLQLTADGENESSA